jgi:hypothetical protein
MTREYKGPEIFAVIILGLVGVPYGWWANAYALRHIWNWYIPPFAPVMTFKVALGLSFVTWALFSGYFINKKKSKDNDGDPWVPLIIAAVLPWVSLGAARLGFWFFFE